MYSDYSQCSPQGTPGLFRTPLTGNEKGQSVMTFVTCLGRATLAGRMILFLLGRIPPNAVPTRFHIKGLEEEQTV